MRREAIVFLIVTLIHFLFQGFAVILSFGGEMERLFGEGGPPSFEDRIIDTVASVLTFPVVWLGIALRLPDIGRIYWEFFLANSLLWGVAAGYLTRLLTGNPSKQGQALSMIEKGNQT